MDNINAKTTNKQAQSNCALETTVNNRSLTPNKKQATRFLEVLGFDPNGNLPLRKFAGKPASKFPNAHPGNLAKLPDNQTPDCGIYLTINGNYGKHKKADIDQCRAIFCEHDDLAIEDQVFLWQQKGLPEPTLQVKTRHSVHSYWVLDQSIPVADWETLQLDLIAHMDSDTAIKDSSRVMRLPGYHHVQHGLEPKLCEIISDSGNYYTFDKLRSLIPKKLAPNGEHKELDSHSDAKENGLSEVLHNVIEPKLSFDKVFYHPNHKWNEKNCQPQKWKGGCPNHESKSETSFYCERKSDNSMIWYCPKCNTGGDSADYLHFAKTGSTRPTGDTFISYVKELSGLLGINPFDYLDKGHKSQLNGNQKQSQNCTQSNLIERIRQVLEDSNLSKAEENLKLAVIREESGIKSDYQWKNDFVNPIKEELASNGPAPQDVVDGELNALIESDAKASEVSKKLTELAKNHGFNERSLKDWFFAKKAEEEQSEESETAYTEVDEILKAQKDSVNLEEVLPKKLAEPIKKLAGWLNLRPETYLTALLCGVSALHHTDSRLILNKAIDFDVSPNLFGALVAPSSQKKSPILKAVATKPLKALQKKAREKYQEDYKQYEKDLERFWELSKSKEDNSKQLKEEFPDGEPAEPKQKVYYFSNATPEGIINQMENLPNQGIVYLKDELAGIFKSLGEYKGGKGSDEENMLSMYDGTGETILRADGKRADFDNALLSIFGTVQPGILQQLLGDGEDANGKWARFIFVNQPATASKMPDDSGGFDLTEMLVDLYERIDSYKSAKTYRLSKEAFSLFRKAYDRYEELRCDPSTPTAMSSVWGKSEGRVGKIALNLHLIKHAFHHSETVPEEIDAETMRSAIELTEFYANQVKALYNELETGSSLSPILAKVVSVAQKKGDWTTARDIRNKLSKQQAKTFTPEKIRWFFSELAEKGYGRVTGEGRTLKFMSCSDGKCSSSPPVKVPMVPDSSPTISQNSHLQKDRECCEASHEVVKSGEESGEDSVKSLVKTSTPAQRDGEDGEDPTQIIKRTGERKVEEESNFDVERDNNPIKEKIGDESSHSSPQSPETAHTENQSNTQNPSPGLHQVFTRFSPTLHHEQQPQEGAGDKQASGEEKAIEHCKLILKSLLANGIEPTPENLANSLGISVKEVKRKQSVLDRALADLS